MVQDKRNSAQKLLKMLHYCSPTWRQSPVTCAPADNQVPQVEQLTNWIRKMHITCIFWVIKNCKYLDC